MTLAGERTLVQGNREITSRAGEALVTGSADTGVAYIAWGNRYISLCIPLKALGGAVLTSPSPRVVASDNEALRLLRSYLRLLGARSPMTPQLQRLAVAHVHELVIAMLGPRSADPVQPAHGMRAARLHTIKQDVICNLGLADVSIGALAARHRLTPRSIQMLFEEENSTLTDFVLGERLERARRRLSEPRHAADKISTIAYDCGFGDLSYFNRVFRARFGATPSQVRVQTQRRH